MRPALYVTALAALDALDAMFVAAPFTLPWDRSDAAALADALASSHLEHFGSPSLRLATRHHLNPRQLLGGQRLGRFRLGGFFYIFGHGGLTLSV